MEKGNLRAAGYHKGWVRFSMKAAIYAWAMAAVFVIGMIAGGLLSGYGPAIGSREPAVPGEAGTGGKARLVLEVPCLDQRGDFPTGCESMTAVMALNFAGVDITAEAFVDGCLPKGTAPYKGAGGEYLCSDPNECFLGDPRSEDGWGCFSPVIMGTVGRVLDEYKSGRTVVDLGGRTLKELIDGYVAEGVPVMVWATQGMEAPSYGQTLTVEATGRRFDWIQPEHCLLLVGEDEESYLFNDPLEGKLTAYEKKAVQVAYEAMGSQALAIK